MSPGSIEQIFEEKMARLDQDIQDIIQLAERNPGVVAAQGVRVQLLLSWLRDWRAGPQLRVVSK